MLRSRFFAMSAIVPGAIALHEAAAISAAPSLDAVIVPCLGGSRDAACDAHAEGVAVRAGAARRHHCGRSRPLPEISSAPPGIVIAAAVPGAATTIVPAAPRRICAPPTRRCS
ncbi:MAG: hypothetical protein KDH15_22580 [Rhodocyclaceae bacterium]|nr:hypothetical protein [Rhodocyclaceae bacterium]